MKVNDILSENDKRGRIAKAGKYPHLYHLTDYRGFSYSVANNALKSLRQAGISFTHNANMNAVGGRDHYHFKFVMDGNALLKNYTGHHYTSSAISIGQWGAEGKHKWKEDEIRIEQSAITPLQDFMLGLVILVPIFSRSFIQWMFYDIKERKSIFGGDVLSAAPRGIESLATVVKKWNQPIQVEDGETIRSLNKLETSFIADCYKLIHSKLTFDQALYHLAEKYPDQIKDHMGGKINTRKIRNAELVKEIGVKFNKLLVGKPILKIDISPLREIVFSGIQQMGITGNDFTRIKAALERGQLFSPAVAPHVWSGIFRHMIDEPIDEFIETIEWFAERERPAIARFADKSQHNMLTHTSHANGSFG